jgi:hypothetical protein
LNIRRYGGSGRDSDKENKKRTSSHLNSPFFLGELLGPVKQHKATTLPRFIKTATRSRDRDLKTKSAPKHRYRQKLAQISTWRPGPVNMGNDFQA